MSEILKCRATVSVSICPPTATVEVTYTWPLYTIATPVRASPKSTMRCAVESLVSTTDRAIALASSSKESSVRPAARKISE